ncbi:unnamed protein product [Linum trigynum]|uniref:Uncharacterized protein n=1 Tax=Linum trigynum TaxID=586398 RepID=A0AAV2EK62_9ROSI
MDSACGYSPTMIESIKHRFGRICSVSIYGRFQRGYHHRFRAIYPKCHFLSILEATDPGIRSRLLSTDNEVY